jgi:hypothetical protein
VCGAAREINNSGAGNWTGRLVGLMKADWALCSDASGTPSNWFSREVVRELGRRDKIFMAELKRSTLRDSVSAS